ncbi:MAG: RusA family crossover junction endodeoxyribonuclease [Gemmatimonadaceae bacterium]|jgi:Holliday junction resolvase RusA-like endonuclease
MSTRRLDFYVAITPVGKARARVTKTGHTYTPDATMKAEADVQWAFKAAFPGHVTHDGPLTILVLATFVVPKSWSKKKRAAALAGTLRHTSKPDADNVLKLVKDALNMVAYTDDSAIYDAHVMKCYGDTAGLSVLLGLEVGT